MKLELLNAVIQAEGCDKVRDGWISTIGLELEREWTEPYHYAELGKDGKFVVGIASAREMGVKPSTPRTNAIMPQLQVEDAKAFLEELQAKGETVVFGPSFEEREEFWFGGFEDVEGNPVWVVTLPERLLPPR